MTNGQRKDAVELDEQQRQLNNELESSRLVRFGRQFLLDAGSWALAIIMAIVLRFGFDLGEINWLAVFVLIVGVIIFQLIAGWALALYTGRYTYGSFEEVRALVAATLGVAVIIGIPLLMLGSGATIPRSIMGIAAPIAIVLMFALRYLKRLYVESRYRPGNDATKTIIYGAGYLGATMVRRMLTDSRSKYRPVAMIDDDPRKSNLQHHGVKVRGSIHDLSRVVEKTGASVLVLCIGYADSELIRRISDASVAAGLTVKVMPLLEDLLEGKTSLNDLRDISIEDLIGRHPVDTEVESIASFLSGKKVLVTGAGGSIGSELCRQISRFDPGELIMLDRDETGLQVAELGIFGHGLLNTKDVVLADIRDSEALEKIFADRQPDVVFHAAALKHLPMLEQYPDEAWKTNVLGTLNVLRAARSVNVTTFVNVSTDKAAEPTSVLGHSKRVAEKLTAWMADETGERYLSVRFGNVIGSRGSMLPTFTSLIESGGPVTVTHPDATRYFMTIPEACQLVVQAGGIGDPAEVLILDMGEPVKILDIAQRMIAMSGKNIEIVFTGLRDGEKLHEDLIGRNETDARPKHPKISHTRVEGIAPDKLDFGGWKQRMYASPRNNDKAFFDRAVLRPRDLRSEVK
ncbi:nucleoside-diphosphate sugar epimerase/dehydratase [Paramicrobacterium agarici]|uniref:nucleoside-diphosphate sugar epimerase/dehydratase n=1 Tax=Paramicrobacterium agarici TaxID=630514 RepID=UPI001169EE45|nr:nucleoside-diphosphate sugar epimerase/dehydratase [Microbacterium agarici]TQO23684.1 FlaA1/EpsC-like NDP-sugar epimerase [Microbacterium agarici]